MNELSRSLLAAAREGLTPDAATMARVRSRIDTRIGAPAKAAAGVKIGGALVVVGLVAGALVARGQDRTAEAPRVAVAPLQTDEAPPPVRARAAEAPVAKKLPESRPAAPESRPVARAAPHEPASLSREVELIDDAMRALRVGDAKHALASIAIFDRETFGHGQMAEDAAAIDIEARCHLEEDVTARLDAFDRKWPSSAQRARIQTACFAR
jgi:hypothetical protein